MPLTGTAATSDASSASSASLVYAPTEGAPAPALPPASSARVTAIGDSVMLGAAQQLAAVTPGIYVDAAVGRQVSTAIALLRQLQANGQLGGILLIDMGNNGTFTDAQFDEIMAVAGPARRVVFVNLKEPRSWEVTNNAVITRGVARYANSVLVDWHDASINRPELFWARPDSPAPGRRERLREPHRALRQRVGVGEGALSALRLLARKRRFAGSRRDVGCSMLDVRLVPVDNERSAVPRHIVVVRESAIE